MKNMKKINWGIVAFYVIIATLTILACMRLNKLG